MRETLHDQPTICANKKKKRKKPGMREKNTRAALSAKYILPSIIYMHTRVHEVWNTHPPSTASPFGRIYLEPSQSTASKHSSPHSVRVRVRVRWWWWCNFDAILSPSLYIPNGTSSESSLGEMVSNAEFFLGTGGTIPTVEISAIENRPRGVWHTLSQ